MTENGERLAIIKCDYKEPKWGRDERGKSAMVSRDCLFVTYQNVDTLQRTFKILPEPKITFYVANKAPRHPLDAITMDCVRPVECLYREREKEMAKALGLYNEFQDMLQQQKSIPDRSEKWKFKMDWMKRRIYNNPSLFMGDIDICDFYKFQFMIKNGNYIGYLKLHVLHMDIETDTSVVKDLDQHAAKCPITSITYCDNKTRLVKAIVKRDKNNPEMMEIERDPLGFLARIMSDEEFQNYDYTYVVDFYDTEEEVIIAWWRELNEISPDVVGVWNGNFDILTILNRMKHLGLDPIEYVIPAGVPDEFRYLRYIEDKKRYEKDSGKRGHWSRMFDYMIVSTPWVYLDQMSVFSHGHKRFMEPSYKLGDIGIKYGNVHKDDLSDHGLHISTAYYKGFYYFLRYALKDVIVQDKIYSAGKEYERLWMQSQATQIRNGTSISVKIKNYIMGYLWREKNSVIGNNIDYDLWEPVSGAIVNKPELIEIKGVNIQGIPSYVFMYVGDFDASSMYPYMMLSMNIDRATVVFSITDILGEDGKHITNPNRYSEDSKAILTKLDLGKHIMTIESSILDLCTEFMEAPAIDTVLKDFTDYIKTLNIKDNAA